MRLLFFLLPILVFALPELPFPEDDPSLCHHVNVISGHLNFSAQDAEVIGGEPLHLTRSYSSSGALERSPENADLHLKTLRKGWMMQGGWALLSHTQILIEPNTSKKEYRAHVAESSGATLSYICYSSSDEVISLKPKTPTYKLSGDLSAKANPYNNRLYAYPKRDRAKLILPDGTVRIYTCEHKALLKGPCYLQLIEERLPSTRKIHYEYDKRSHLKKIYTANNTGSKVFSVITFEYLQYKDHPFALRCKTSCGQEIVYGTMKHKDRCYLCLLYTSPSPRDRG